MTAPIRKQILLQLVDKLQGIVSNFAAYSASNSVNPSALTIAGTYADPRACRKFSVTALTASSVSITEITTPVQGEIISSAPITHDITNPFVFVSGVTLQSTTLTPGDAWQIRVGNRTQTLYQVQPYWNNSQNESLPSATIFVDEATQTPMPLNRYEYTMKAMAMVKMSVTSPEFLLVEDLAQDVKDEISRDVNLYDGTNCLATNVVVDGDKIFPDESGTDVVVFTISFTVTFRSAFANGRQFV